MNTTVIFLQKVDEINKLSTAPSNEDLLKLYAYFKQASFGNISDNNISYPGMFDFKGKAKYNSWKSVENMSKNEAMIKYIELSKKILN